MLDIDTSGDGSAEPAGLARLRDEVWAGLHRRELSSKWFYDTRGSQLFEAITRLPEYYPTRTEQALLERHTPRWMERVRPACILELGAGSARKTRVLLDAMEAERPRGSYLPVDVSAEFLDATAEELRREYPDLTVEPVVADLSRPLRLDRSMPRPLLAALLGSTIGNFRPLAAVRLLGGLAGLMRPGDRFLMGADLRPGPGKSRGVLEAAYNDAAGVTAEFNLNMLRRLNREAGTDFDLSAFRHHACYDDVQGRIEMYLVPQRDVRVNVPGRGAVALAAGEGLRTEISCKYDLETVEALFDESGLAVDDWVTDEGQRYALALGRLR